jgi:NAD(P)-dependent dehydrogenase (short-subunit alcohol dehydrogenase family)
MPSTEQCLKKLVVLVVGASSGIGRATAIASATAGAEVILASRNEAALALVQAALEDQGSSVLAVPTDATDAAAVARLVEQVVAKYGRIDVVVNTVGTNIPKRALSETTSESWGMMVSINLTSAFNITKAVVPVFRQQQGGLIIHVSSSAAKKPDASGIAYQATKAGVVGIAHGTMEEERKHGIRTTVIFPGLTDTPMVLKRPVATPPEVLARALQPEDVAAAALFVMSLPARAHVPELVICPSNL